MAVSLKHIYDHMCSYVHTPYALPFLAVIFFFEAIFFIPTDPVLIFYCLEQPDRAYTFSGVSTIASVLGGLTSYMLGLYFWHAYGTAVLTSSWITMWISPTTVHHLMQQFSQYDWWAILIAGFTPVPYKAAAFAAGCCHISLIPVIFGSLIARGARFFTYAIIIRFAGIHIKQVVYRYFNYLMLTTVALCAAGYYFVSS